MTLFTVLEKEHSKPLRLYIKEKYPEFSAKKVEQLLNLNGCKLNGKIERFGSKKVMLGDQVKIYPAYLKSGISEEARIPILFEDEYLIVIDKPTGIASDRELLSKALKQKIYLAHRLDKMTSGVLILTKTQEALNKMEQLFFDRSILKNYLAVVHGRVSKASGEITDALKLHKRFEGGVQYKTAPFGKKAHTLFKRVALGKNESLLLLRPITGRTHQLRVHLSSMGHSILGDPVYTREPVSKLDTARLLLHAYKVSFIHPFSGKEIAFIAPIPLKFDSILKRAFKKVKLCDF